MENLKILLFVTIISMVFVRCSGPRVIAFTGNKPDFGAYYSYRIQHPAKPEETDPEAVQFQKSVAEAINEQMILRNYEMAEVPDMVITYSLILDNKADYDMDRTGRYGYNNRYNYPYNTTPYYMRRREYTEGTLLVELRENLDNSLIWQASLDLKFNKRSSSKKKVDPVENAFITIFSEYPYMAGNNKPQNLQRE